MGDDAGEGGGKVRYPLSVIVVYLIFFAERTASFSAGGTYYPYFTITPFLFFKYFLKKGPDHLLGKTLMICAFLLP